MSSINQVFISGNLGAKPEKKLSKNGKEFYSASLASHRHWLNKNEEWESRTDWHTLFFWSPKSKKNIANLDKGHPIVVEGEIVTFEKNNDKGDLIKSAAIEVKDLKSLQKNNNDD